MPFEVGRAVNGAAEWMCRSSLVNSFATNVIFAALIITAMVIVIILAVFVDVRKSSAKTIAKSAVYILVGVTLVMFVHHYALEQQIRRDYGNAQRREMFESIQGGTSGTDHSVHQSVLGGEHRTPDHRSDHRSYHAGGWGEESRRPGMPADIQRAANYGRGEPQPHAYDTPPVQMTPTTYGGAHALPITEVTVPSFAP